MTCTDAHRVEERLTYILERVDPHPDAEEKGVPSHRIVLRPIGYAAQVGATELALNVHDGYWRQLCQGQPLVDVIIRAHR